METRNEKKRCSWATGKERTAYHDNEYGRVVTDDNKLFELICLVMFGPGKRIEQVLEKREEMRPFFMDFDIMRCAELPDDYLTELSETTGRSRSKIAAVRTNARAAIKVIADFESLFKFVYSFKSPERFRGAMKKYGFVYMGIAAASRLMRMAGILDGHESDCFMSGSGKEER